MRKPHHCYLLLIMIVLLMGSGGADGASEQEKTSDWFFHHHPKEVDYLLQGDRLYIANRHIGLEFLRSEHNFELRRLYDIPARLDFLLPEAAPELLSINLGLDPALVKDNDQRQQIDHGILKNVMPRMAKRTGVFTIYGSAALKTEWELEQNQQEITVKLHWRHFNVKEKQNCLQATAQVTLQAGDRLSRWRIQIENRSPRYGLERIRFPQLAFAPIGAKADNCLTYPKWRGGLIQNPFAAKPGLGERYHDNGAYYPYYVNMQFFSLYNQHNRTGLYFGTFDPLPNMIQYHVDNQPGHIGWSVSHFPDNLGFKDEDYQQNYDSVVGSFQGDWYDAAMLYRHWATRQSWCRKGKSAERKDIPAWSKTVPLHFYTSIHDSADGTHDKIENQRIAAADAMQWLKWSQSSLVFNWYGWCDDDGSATQNNWPGQSRRKRNRQNDRWYGFVNRHSSFGNYPKQPAVDEFRETARQLRKAGGHLVPYLCATIYDNGSTDNAPYAAVLKNSASRDLFGNVLMYENLGWNMCSHCPAWQQRLSDEAQAVIGREKVGGVYLDTIHGMAQPCYWTPHGHSAAGGHCGPGGMHQLIQKVYDDIKKVNPEALVEGEDPAENMIDVQDNILYQRHLRLENKVPLFAAVYGDYIPRSTVGKISLADPAFFIECASLFLEGAQVGRLTLRPRPTSTVLNFNKPEHQKHFAFLKQIVDYYKLPQARQFFCSGQLLRPVLFNIPVQLPMLAYQSEEVGETDSGATLSENQERFFPALQNGVFRAANGQVGIFLANVSTEAIDFSFTIKPEDYGWKTTNPFLLQQLASDGSSTRLPDSQTDIAANLPPRQITLYLIKFQ